MMLFCAKLNDKLVDLLLCRKENREEISPLNVTKWVCHLMGARAFQGQSKHGSAMRHVI